MSSEPVHPLRPGAVLLAVLALAGPGLVRAQSSSRGEPLVITIRQSAGVDSRVDYAGLLRYGPWDDRNYRLTAADVELLEDDERFDVPVPAFYRVWWRRQLGDVAGRDLLEYPRSLLPRFRTFRGGFLVDGLLYRNATSRDQGYRVLNGEARTPLDYLLQRSTAFTGEARVSFSETGAESATAIHPHDPAWVVAGSNSMNSNGQVMHYSTDGGATWSPGGGLVTGTCCDPTVAWSTEGSYAYVATLGSTRNKFYRSGDGGQTWDDLPDNGSGDPLRVIGSGSTDKEYLHVDVSSSSPYTNRIYMSWHEANVMQVAHSSNFGESWSTPLSFPGEPYGLASDITTDADGDLYYFYPNLDPPPGDPSDVRLLRSTDGGATFSPSTVVADTEVRYEWPIPVMDSRRTWVYVSADTDRTCSVHRGNVYVAWTDSTGPVNLGDPQANHARIRVAASSDGGASWTVTTPHPTADQNTVDRFHPWLGVDEVGRVHVVFYDTGQDPVNRLVVDLHHAASSDGGLTWSTPQRLTTESSPKIANSFEWGDYNGLDIVDDQLVAIYTDNRDEGGGGGGDSRDVYSIAIALDSGAVFLDGIFSSGFECGDLLSWSTVQP